MAIFAVGYMHGDPGYPRFFAEVSLFVFSMTMLVSSSNLVLLYVFWEAVGLCSYLLIGFWFEKPAAAAAAKKAFLVNRIGDFGFALGIFLMWRLVGQTLQWHAARRVSSCLTTRRSSQVAEQLRIDHPNLLLTAALLLVCRCGAARVPSFRCTCGLPDAMEGPTPVSALIHAATMVTAGVYMVARLSPLFVHVPDGAGCRSPCIGGVTALLAALIALTQIDLKRVLAYSTVSQLGFMFLALGCGVGDEQLAAIAGDRRHVSPVHARVFQGPVVPRRRQRDARDGRRDRHAPLRRAAARDADHALDVSCRRAGAGRHSAAVGLLEQGRDPGRRRRGGARTARIRDYYAVLQYVALVTSLLTAFYTFRAYFMTFWGETKIPQGGRPSCARIAAGDDRGRSWCWPCARRVWALLLGPTHRFFHYLRTRTGLAAREPHPMSAIGDGHGHAGRP